MNVVLLVAGSVLVPLLITGAVLVIVFRQVRIRIDRAAEELTGVELDSGTTLVTTRFTAFRSPELISSGMRRNHGRLVLTATHLHLVQRPQRYGVIPRSDLDHFTVRDSDGELVIRSTDPPGATGTVEYRLTVPGTPTWVAALTAAGARGAG